jgi:GAF domain-containing protein
MMRRFFSPPVFEKEEDNFRAKFINGFAWTVIVLLLLAIAPHLLGNSLNFTIPVFSGLILVMITALYLLHRGNVNTSGMIIVVLGWLGIGIQAYTADGVKDVIVVAYLALGLLASIILSWRAGGVVILTSIGAIWALTFLQVNGYFTPSSQAPLAFSRDLSFVFIAVSVLVYFSTTSLRNAIRRANESEKGLVLSNQRLQELNESLEDRVASRTTELETANQRNVHRARQFEAIAQVVQAATSIQDIDMLLNRLTQVISQQFGFYHIAIFLLDEQGDNAVLRASNSEGGRRMLARRHSIKISQVSIVANVTATGNPRLALDVGPDAISFDNPDLPKTHSEIALPLKVAGEIIGALDVQSTESDAFAQEDVEVLSTLADQVAIVIQNARSYATTRRLLEEAQKTSRSYVRDSWRVLQSQSQHAGFLMSGNILKPLDKFTQSPLINKATIKGEAAFESGEKANLAVPIRVGGIIVGVIDIHLPQDHEWDPDEIDIVEAVADRLSLALESATLLQVTQRRAEIERLTADISGKISSTTQFDSILRTAAEELSRVLGGSDVLVQIQTEALEIQTTPDRQSSGAML